MKKTVSDAVERFGGVWGGFAQGMSLYWDDQDGWIYCNGEFHGADFVCTRAEFEAEAERRKHVNHVVHSDTLVEPGTSDAWKELEVSEKWNGEGLPPVGELCEAAYTPQIDRYWPNAQLICVDDGYVFFKREGKNKPLIRSIGAVKFRPLKTKEEREREEEITKLQSASQGKMGAPISATQAINLYDSGCRVVK